MRVGNYRQGEEHGSARWATPREAARFADAHDPFANIILTRHVSLALTRADHDPRYERNRNVLVVGGSGSGKTRGYVLPNLLQANASLLVTDPKGTLAGEVGPVLSSLGYRVRRIDTVDFRRSDHYNPIAYVRTQQDVLELVDCLIANTTRTRSDTADPFWENSERLLYTALVSYLVDHCLREDANLPGLMGYVAGKPGSGKSFSVKREIENTILAYPDDQVIIFDPAGEYSPVVVPNGGTDIRLGPDSPAHLNPFDVADVAERSACAQRAFKIDAFLALSGATMAHGVWERAVLPIGCGVLSLVFTVQLIHISQRMCRVKLTVKLPEPMVNLFLRFSLTVPLKSSKTMNLCIVQICFLLVMT